MVPAQNSKDQRLAFSYTMTGVCGVTLAYAAKNTVWMFVSTMAPAADALAMAKIEVDISAIPEGKSASFVWRGKPLFVRNRSVEEIADVRRWRDA